MRDRPPSVWRASDESREKENRVDPDHKSPLGRWRWRAASGVEVLFSHNLNEWKCVEKYGLSFLKEAKYRAKMGNSASLKLQFIFEQIELQENILVNRGTDVIKFFSFIKNLLK